MENLVNVNKSNEGLLVVGAQLVEKKNGNTAVIVKINMDGKFNVVVNNEEKTYSFATLQRNWQIVEKEIVKKEVALDMEIVLGLPTPVKTQITSEGVYIFDNKTEKQGKVNITGHVYNVPVKADNINQTTMWKVLMELYKNRKEENDVYPLEQKQFCVKQLKELDLETFEGAYRCLVSKTKKEYIDSLLEA